MFEKCSKTQMIVTRESNCQREFLRIETWISFYVFFKQKKDRKTEKRKKTKRKRKVKTLKVSTLSFRMLVSSWTSLQTVVL